MKTGALILFAFISSASLAIADTEADSCNNRFLSNRCLGFVFQLDGPVNRTGDVIPFGLLIPLLPNQELELFGFAGTDPDLKDLSREPSSRYSIGFKAVYSRYFNIDENTSPFAGVFLKSSFFGRDDVRFSEKLRSMTTDDCRIAGGPVLGMSYSPLPFLQMTGEYFLVYHHDVHHGNLQDFIGSGVLIEIKFKPW